MKKSITPTVVEGLVGTYVAAWRAVNLIVEEVFSPGAPKPQLWCCHLEGRTEVGPCVPMTQLGIELYPLDNALVRKGRIILPGAVEPYDSTAALLAEIRDFIRRYVWIPPTMVDLVAYFVLYTWIFDRFGTAVYLHFVGDLGSGKTRALDVLARLCYHAFHAAGGTTRSALFRTLDLARGTLVLDETDFSTYSEDHRELMRMLRNGWQVGHPHMLSEGGQDGWEPKCYEVFGPKVIGGRQAFPDPALESRCITIYMPPTAPIDGIPTSLPEDFDSLALPLRNKLLQWRADHVFRPIPTVERLPIEGRLMQLFEPLAATIALGDDPTTAANLRRVMLELQGELTESRRTSPEGSVVGALLTRSKPGTRIHLKDVAASLDWDPKKVASICRALGLDVRRDGGGNYVMFNQAEHPALLKKYGHGMEAV